MNKTGHWIEKIVDIETPFGKIKDCKVYVCPKCGFEPGGSNTEVAGYKFCPNCGKKMANQMKEIQTCQEHCKHEDCIYRRTLGHDTPICFYAVIMRESRGCKISECDKYRRGTKKVKSTYEYIEWDIYYDDDYF